MRDLFGYEIVSFQEEKVCFSDLEIDWVCDAILSEGELLKQLGVTLKKLRALPKGMQAITAIRKQIWEEFIWVFDLGEPACVTFDMACEICGLDAENIRASIGREFGEEIRIMYQFIGAYIPERTSLLRKRLCEYVNLNFQ